MPFVLLGISHQTAPIALRERLALTARTERRWFAGKSVRRRLTDAGLAEFAFLSTCNRSELYAAAGDPRHRFADPPGEVLALLAELGGLPLGRLRPHLYVHTGRAVLHHLCRVAAGLDSMLLGEAEILGQVGRARDLATRHGTVGPLLDECFRTAIRSGRRARAETGICRGSASIGTEAARLLEEAPSDPSVLIVGSGKVGRLTAATLRARGVRRLAVINRTGRHARALAREWGATALPWSNLAAAIRDADAVLCSTSAPQPVITRQLIRRALGPRGDGRRRLLVDLAVPRNIEPAVGSFPGIELHDIDSFQHRLDVTLASRRREVPAVESLIAEELTRFEHWLAGAMLRPLLTRLHAQGETIRRRELDRFFRRTQGLPPGLRSELERFSTALVSALLDPPSRHLRNVSDPGQLDLLGAATRQLFGLDLAAEQPVSGGSAA